MMRWIGLGLFAAAAWAADLPDCKTVTGWAQKGPTRSYDAETLFEYMNGNAEGYLIYQFATMRGITCVSGGDSILIDISEMADAESAYGIYCANRDPQTKEEKIGTVGQVRPRRAVFVKDKYYVELAANPAKDHSPALRSFVAAIEPRIPGSTAIPQPIGWFPTEGLASGSLRLIPESVLGLRILKRGYVGQYGKGKAFLVAEATPDAAKALLEKLKARIGETTPAKLADEAFDATDKYLGRMFVFRKGRYLGGAAGTEQAQSLAAALATRVP